MGILLDIVGTIILAGFIGAIIQVLWWFLTILPRVLVLKLIRWIKREASPTNFRNELVGSMSENVRNSIWGIRWIAMFYAPFLLMTLMRGLNASFYAPTEPIGRNMPIFGLYLNSILVTFLFFGSFVLVAPCYRKIAFIVATMFFFAMLPQVGVLVPLPSSAFSTQICFWMFVFNSIGYALAFSLAYRFDEKENKSENSRIGLLEVNAE
jgi:hypothetical protein